MFRPFLISALLLHTFASSSNAQCNLTCNNLIQVSLDSDCSIQITAHHLLEGDTSGICPGGVIVVEANFNNTWENAVFNKNHIGQTIQVRVRDTVSKTTCWGYASIEDKINPSITCVNDTLPILNIQDTASFLITNIETFPIIEDNCEVYATTYVDTFWAIPALSPFDAKICRTWRVSDFSGNFSTCIQTFYFEQVNYVRSTIPSQEKKYSMKVYPNPSSGLVHVETNIQQLKNISLLNMQGAILHQWKGVQQSLSFEIPDLPNSMYYLILQNTEGIVARTKLQLIR